jgi:hypothetical protein
MMSPRTLSPVAASRGIQLGRFNDSSKLNCLAPAARQRMGDIEQFAQEQLIHDD